MTSSTPVAHSPTALARSRPSLTHSNSSHSSHSSQSSHSGPSSSSSTSAASSTTHLSFSHPPILKSHSTFTSTTFHPLRTLGRLQPKCNPSKSGGGQLKKYRQPASAIIPYPRGEVNIIECIEHRRGIKVLGKLEGYEDFVLVGAGGHVMDGGQVVVVRHKTIGGECKRIWEKVAFWDRAKTGRSMEDEDDRDDEDENEWN